MSYNPFNSNAYDARAYGQPYAGAVNIADVMRQVYLWLAAGLIVGFGVSYAVGHSSLPVLHSSLVWIVALIGYLVLGFAFYPIVQRASIPVAVVLYLVFTALFGLMISSIWLVYASGPIWQALITTAAMFGMMSIIGFTTKVDLSKFRSILFMGLIGLIVASLINIFIGGGVLYFIITLFGIVLFCGLTAYDTQWIQRNAASVAYSGNGQAVTRLALVGAFHLFMDFVNLFLYLLRLFGLADRR